MSNHISLIIHEDWERDGSVVYQYRTLTVCVATGVRHALTFQWDGYCFWTQCHTCSEPLSIPTDSASHTVIDLTDETHLERLQRVFSTPVRLPW